MEVVHPRRDDPRLGRIHKNLYERSCKQADQHADADAEHSRSGRRAPDALTDALRLVGPVVLGHIGGERVAEILHRHIGKGINFDRRCKGRHDDRAKTVDQALHHQDAKVHDGLLDAGHNGQIQDGSSKLYDGSKELGDGLKKLDDGSDTLQSSLADGAETVKENKAEDVNYEMIAAPVDDDEAKMTEVPNNGHAMAPYMMSVGLWVGALAFCLMYPLTKYNGKLKSGFAWWGSKASVLYPLAILQGILVIFLLHVFDGFTPAQMGKAVAFACLTSVAFTSIMYFFNITLGKVGSFLMLVFMVVQLAGSAGTYPVEISPEFVSKIHAYLPFTYTVDAFRATISGGRSITTSVIVLAVLFVIFTILTILQFNHMAKRKKAEKVVLFDWLEERGLA